MEPMEEEEKSNNEYITFKMDYKGCEDELISSESIRKTELYYQQRMFDELRTQKIIKDGNDEIVIDLSA